MARIKVAIVGGGPSGLILAIELGRRGVPCVLLEEDATPPTLPKANATTSRTMEHYRRLGFAAEIRALGLPEDYPQDIAYFTRSLRKSPDTPGPELQGGRPAAMIALRKPARITP